ncbi:hypothetical protein FRC07_008768, partial [Ceratobasidium sp. 392]
MASTTCTRPQFCVYLSTQEPMEPVDETGYMRKRSSSRLSSTNLGFTALNSSGSKTNLQSLYPRRDSDTFIVSKSPTNSPPRSRRPSPAGSYRRPSASPHDQRRSCPSSPSASFVNLTPPSSGALSPRLQRRTRSRSNTTSSPVAAQPPQTTPTPTPAPICIRSRSSSHPHLSSVLPPQNSYFATFGGRSLVSSAGPSSPVAPFFTSSAAPAPGYLSIGPRRMDVEDSDGDQDPILFGRQIHHGSGSIGRIRSRTHIGGGRAGHVTETETEREGPPRVLPTARGPTHYQPSATPLMTRLIPLLMLSFRLLAIVPATIGTVIHVHNVVHPPEGTLHTRIDFGVAACWSVLTGFQCWFLTCGLLQRWIAYYPLLSTLVRLLALQAICWPATHITLSVLDAVAPFNSGRRATSDLWNEANLSYTAENGTGQKSRSNAGFLARL